MRASIAPAACVTAHLPLPNGRLFLKIEMSARSLQLRASDSVLSNTIAVKWEVEASNASHACDWRAAGDNGRGNVGSRLRERILNILSFLSQSLLNNKDLVYDAQEIWDDLGNQGYSEDEIELALAHIERMSLQVPGPYWTSGIPTYRTYAPGEATKLTARARGYLWQLKSRGVIDHALEDEIVHKAMNLAERAGVREIKTVAALTIFGYEHRIQIDTETTSTHGSWLN